MISIRQYFVVAALILVAALVKTTTAFATNDSPEAKQVDAIFADLAKPGSPGCALAVARGGKIIYEKGYGLANLEQEVPITPRTVFDIGSTSKTVRGVMGTSCSRFARP